MNDSLLRWVGQAWFGLPDEVCFATIALLGAWLVMYPAGWVIAGMMRARKAKLEQAIKGEKLSTPSRGFADGGAAIGRLERLLIYLFVLCDALGAVGFLIAAKSIFRFGELSDHNNRLEAEYITIGTLLSFAIGLAAAMTFRWALFGDPA